MTADAVDGGAARPAPDPRDAARVAALLGREPRGRWDVVVRDGAGDPVVVRNAPLLDDGTPMPTRYWLVGPAASRAAGRLEAEGGVDAAERTVPAAAVAATHARYAAERDAALPAGHPGPLPSGGVGGTREGVKCLHAHLAHWLAGGDDAVGDWIAARLAPPVAAIDVGSNSTNLLVVDGAGAELARIVSVTRLGEGLATGATSGPSGAPLLSDAAIGRTVARLAEYRRECDRLGVRLARVVGTAACRRAANVADLAARVRDATGWTLDVVAPEREAALAWAGAVGAGSTPAADAAGASTTSGTLLVDIGGASTELAVGPDRAASIAHGAVSVTESHLAHDPPRPEELTNAIAEVGDAVTDLAAVRAGDAAWDALRAPARVIGVAGTIVTAAAVELGLREWDAGRLHGFVLGRAAAEDVFRTLATEPLADRVHNPGLPRERADVIVGGCCVLVAIMRRLALDGIIVSTRSLLDGLAAEARRATLVAPT
ncbi:MAG: hypothetical protein RL283_1697 [Actinomycetota bacterium]